MQTSVRQEKTVVKKARIMVVDDHPVVRAGLQKLINREPDLIVCSEAGTAQMALELAAEGDLDLAVVDVLLKNTTGIQVAAALKVRYPDLPVLVFSMSDEMHYVRRAFQAGARGYMIKDEVANGIVDAIRQVLGGKIYISEDVARRLSVRQRQSIEMGDFSDLMWECR